MADGDRSYEGAAVEIQDQRIKHDRRRVVSGNRGTPS